MSTSNLIPLKVITDLYEETSNRPTAANSKENIRPITKLLEEKLENYIASTSQSSSGFNSITFNQNPFKSLNKQNDEYNHFTQRVAHEFTHLKKTKKYTGSSYRFPISNQAVTSSLAVNAAEVSPLLQASEDRVKALENEMDLREKDLLKIVGMMNILMEENTYLRDHISVKSKEFFKLLETIGYNDSGSVYDLKNKVTLLNDENNILKSHLDQYKNSNMGDLTFTREKAIDYEVLTIRNKELKESLEEAIKREEMLASYRQAVEPKFKIAQNQIVGLEARIQELEEELAQVNNRLAQATTQGDKTKQKLQEIEVKSSTEITRLTYDVDMLRKEKEEIMKLVEDRKQTDEENDGQLRKARKDLELFKLENEEMVQTIHQLRNELSAEKFEGELVFKRETEVKERNKQLSTEIERLHKKIVDTEEEHKNKIDNLNAENLTKETKSQQKIDKLKAKLAEEAKERDNKISLLEIKFKETERALLKLQREKDEYAQKLTRALTDQEDLEQREQIIVDYEYRVRNLEKELRTVQTERDYLDRKSRENALKTPNVARRIEYDPSFQMAPSEQQPQLSTRRNSKDIEKENDYLRLLLKNSVEEEEAKKPPRRSSQTHRHRPSSVTPAQRDSYRHDPRPTSNVRSSYRDTSVQRERMWEPVGGVSRIEDGLISYRSSVKIGEAEVTRRIRKQSMAEGQLLDEENIERVVGSIMKKYNLKEIPDFSGQKEKFKGELEAIFVTERVDGPRRRNGQNVPILPLKACIPPLYSHRDSVTKDTQANTETGRVGSARSLPMSPDKDHKGAQKSVIQELDDDVLLEN